MLPRDQSKDQGEYFDERMHCAQNTLQRIQSEQHLQHTRTSD